VASRTVIVGASLAGLRIAETLRQEGFGGPITLLGAEPDAPYDRPPLSKGLLAGTVQPSEIDLRSPSQLRELGVEFVRGVAATGLDLAAATLDTTAGPLSYDRLAIATGSAPRELARKICPPGVRGVYYLRTRVDALALRRALGVPGVRLVVIGAGVIGAEVAATARGLGASVDVVEPLLAPLVRVVGAVAGGALGEIHRARGVRLHLGQGVAQVLAGRDEGHVVVEGVELSDGRVLPADAVLVAIGAAPVTGWLEGSGLEVHDGLCCDTTLAAAERVVAAGDVVRFWSERAGRSMRLEHWTNAAEQGTYAGRRLLAGWDGWRRERNCRSEAGPGSDPSPAAPLTYDPIPYVWSDQYDLRLQIVGFPSEHDEFVVVDGDLAAGRGVGLYGREGHLVAVLGIGRARLVMDYRRLLDRRASLAEAIEHRQAGPGTSS